jgi:predicted dehydrogenase
VSRSHEAIEKFRLKNGAEIDGFTDYAEALRQNFDAVVISAPHRVHVPLAIEALRAGKHVLIEKPLSDSFPAALELAAEAKKSSGAVMVSQNFRYREPLWRMRAATQVVGKISALQVEMIQEYGDYLKNVAKNNKISCLLEEVFIHQADQARFLLGSNPVKVYADAWNDPWDKSGQANNAVVLVEFENGARLNYHGSWSAPKSQTTWAGNWHMRGELGSVEWDGRDHEGVILQPKKGLSLTLPPADGFPGFDRVGVLREFADAIDHRRPPMCSLEDNLWSFGMVAAAVMSVEQKRSVRLSELLS